ncbi:ATPase, T2SS/T4P/T4SS family [Vibrio anguillarum]|nr:ATPase, T2SS/T4P/T4SS family [Vibrio anguillarum]
MKEEINSLSDLGEIIKVITAEQVGSSSKHNKFVVMVIAKPSNNEKPIQRILVSDDLDSEYGTYVSQIVRDLREAGKKLQTSVDALDEYHVSMLRVDKDIIINALTHVDKGDNSSDTNNIREVEAEKMLHDAFMLKASDIHISGDEKEAFIKFRINGELEFYGVHGRAKAEVTSLVSVMYSNMASKDGSIGGKEFDANTKADGVIYRNISGKRIGARIATHPTTQKNDDFYMVLRVLGDQNAYAEYITFENLGYLFNQPEQIRSALYGKGITLIIGETNSGKSVTSQNMLMQIHKDTKGTKSIYSIENPIERKIYGVRQFNLIASGEQTQEDLEKRTIGLLSWIVRGDPDVLSIAEIRDKMTANASIQLALTGHNIISTLHCDSPFDAYERLIGLGANALTLRSSKVVKIVVSQKLLSELCPTCSHSIDEVKSLTPEQMNAIEQMSAIGLSHKIHRLKFRNYTGCSQCRFGLISRVLVAESVPFTNSITSALINGDKVKAQAEWFYQGGISKVECAIYRAFEGRVDIGLIKEELGDLTITYHQRKKCNAELPRGIYA